MTSDIIKRLEAARAGCKPATSGGREFRLGPDPKRWPSAARSAYWDVVRALNAWGKEHKVAFGVYDNLAVANRAVRETWGFK